MSERPTSANESLLPQGKKRDALESSETPATTGPSVVKMLEADFPSQLGRYRIKSQLGSGSFGTVYRAYDADLDREVAIKVSHSHRITSAEEAAAYLAEARVVASLDHPGIVPIYDVGRSDDGLCYLVSKFIEGSDLRNHLKERRPPLAETVQTMICLAEALHHAHQRGLVHRDIKPANILLDVSVQPFITDFGLALKEEDFGRGPGYVGTPGYMSPEQAWGEGHRVDARTDIYSLGVVFYEMLTGRRPFHGTIDEVLQQIRSQEPRPPRQLDDAVPKELDRICLKAMAKRAVDRHSTARDLAEDLRHTQVTAKSRSSRPVEVRVVVPSAPDKAVAAATPPSSIRTESGAIRVVPKGLRSFDATDTDFFLELVPGPRDRDGVPENIRFWKTRIDEIDADNTFRVGMLYGPSGCGKSSLVKAGLLPRLGQHVTVVYLEATPEDTETRLLNGLRKRCPRLPDHLGLVESLTHLRRGQGTPAGTKILLVLDQFEQWLHALRNEQNTELVQALRQCDGSRVQCLLMVRDDFWMAATRFMHDLEIRLLEGQNSSHVDLFDIRHARKVLTVFGRAFGALPDGVPGPEHELFLTQAAAGLAQDGKVIPVRLSLFAEMVKGKAWTPATLKRVGGMEGIGVTFFEEMFSASTAPPEHRFHQKAARAVLKALLPEQASDIKGHMRAHEELLEASGYARRPREFDALLTILDAELRLVTPTDPEGTDGSPVRPGRKFYQLTHDYLVPALQQWLARKQRETVRGRAELCLAERAGLWSAKPANRHLPSWWEWGKIRLFTRKRDWTEPQQRMMRKAGRFYAVWTVVGVAFLIIAGWSAYARYGSQRAAVLVERLKTLDTPYVADTIAEITPYRRWAEPLLVGVLENPNLAAKEKLHARLVLAPIDPNQVEPIFQEFLRAPPETLPVIRTALEHHKDSVLQFCQEESQRQIPPQQIAEARDALVKGQARADTLLLLWGTGETVWANLRHSAEPSRRTHILHNLALLGASPDLIIGRLEAETDDSIRRVLILSLGNFNAYQLSEEQRQNLLPRLLAWYRDDPDPGIHSAIDWLLRYGRQGKTMRKLDWQQADMLKKTDTELARRPPGRWNWYVTKEGHTMTIVRDPAVFQMGAPSDEKGRMGREVLHAKRIPRTFAIASKEVIVEQYRRFLEARPGIYRAFEDNAAYQPDEDGPVTALRWFEAAAYCNWLSKKEGLPETEWCYPAGIEKIEGTVELPANFLQRTGYRLPTEAEWEYACRAGSQTSRFFGNSVELLKDYAWHKDNANGRAWPVGQLKPNDFGLFDILGNALEWCQDKFEPYEAEPSEDVVDPSINASDPRVLRGVSFNHDAALARSAYRYSQLPTNRLLNGGFRVARTYR